MFKSLKGPGEVAEWSGSMLDLFGVIKIYPKACTTLGVALGENWKFFYGATKKQHSKTCPEYGAGLSEVWIFLKKIQKKSMWRRSAQLGLAWVKIWNFLMAQPKKMFEDMPWTWGQPGWNLQFFVWRKQKRDPKTCRTFGADLSENSLFVLAWQNIIQGHAPHMHQQTWLFHWDMNVFKGSSCSKRRAETALPA